MQAKLNAAFAAALSRVRVVPVLTIATAEEGVGLARALCAGGLDAIEVTLRTPAALDAMRAIRAEVPEARVGAGTVLTPEQGRDAILAGAQFIVSPGMTPRLIEAAESWPVPFLPGAVTASEAMALSDLGYRVLKFFPAESCGGAAALKALAAPLAGIAFCPTGGIAADNAGDYLALPNVAAVGGSWVAPARLVAARDWDGITALARSAVTQR
ncbi:MAG: bifunctional 4-hydroxy-2-oxoglutarate aldolase/2-dehydro-3-deoxy-phosphogluconate aldolase [Hyphomicrobiaceae bacterium]